MAFRAAAVVERLHTPGQPSTDHKGFKMLTSQRGRLATRWGSLLIYGLACCLLGNGLSGCGKKSGNSDAVDNGSEEVPEEHVASGSDSEPKKPARNKKIAKQGKGERIGEIPKDAWPEVWLKNPLAVVAEKGPAVGVKSTDTVKSTADQTGGSEKTTNPPPKAASSGASSGGGGGDWASIITGEDITDESKAIKTSLTDKLQSVGKYSGNYKDVRVDAAVLAALAGIVIDHPESVSWKPNAKFIRDVSGTVSKEAKANGQKFYDPTKAAYDKLDALLSGSKPPDVGEAADKANFSESANRGPLMIRMEKAFNYMKLTVNTEDLFKKEKSKVSHEGSLLAVLSKVIASPGYDSADEDEYKNYANDIVKAGQDIVKSVKDEDFKAYSDALNRSFKACADCHQNYRNN